MKILRVSEYINEEILIGSNLNLYHGTDSYNVPNILTRGLTPGDENLVYLTTKKEAKKKGTIVLQIDTKGLNLQPSGKHFITNEVIPPKKIKFA
jgi:RNA:NAD 2'-phosphotransferase (TPT1/KptA family)